MKVDISKYKKVALCGSHGIGKTTLAKRIEIFGYNYIPEVARDLIEKIPNAFDWKTIDKDIYRNFELSIFYSHVFYIQTIKSPFISDRTVYDVAAYCYLRGMATLSRNIIEYVNNHIPKFYDIILFYRNGYKEKDKEGEKIDNILETILTCNNINFLEINKDDFIVLKNNKEIII